MWGPEDTWGLVHKLAGRGIHFYWIWGKVSVIQVPKLHMETQETDAIIVTHITASTRVPLRRAALSKPKTNSWDRTPKSLKPLFLCLPAVVGSDFVAILNTFQCEVPLDDAGLSLSPESPVDRVLSFFASSTQYTTLLQ